MNKAQWEILSQGGREVYLIDFRKFGVKKREARKVRNPKTKKEMVTQAKLIPYFKAEKGLKEQVAAINH